MVKNMDYRLSGLISELQRIQEEHEANEMPWKNELIKNDKGKVENRIENYLLYFNKSEKYRYKLKYNEFLQQKEFNGKEWTDFDEDIAVNNIEKDIELSNVLNGIEKEE